MSNYAELAKDARAIADRLELIPDGFSGEDELWIVQGQVQDLEEAVGDALEELHQAEADEDDPEQDEADAMDEEETAGV